MKWNWWYLLNPLAYVADWINGDEPGRPNGMSYGEQMSNLGDKIGDASRKVYNDATGQTQIEQQNNANLELAKYQAQMNEEFYNKYSSPAALMRQFQEAGLNPNLMYGGAGSGQGNVPSYSAPSVNRKLSGLDQISRAFGLVSGIMNVQNLLYNTVASREIAEQNSVKTLGLIEDVINKRRNNAVEGFITGYYPTFGQIPLFKRSAISRRPNSLALDLPMLERYSNAMRAQRFNRAMKDSAYNMFEFGSYVDPYGDTVVYKPYDDWKMNALLRNKILEFDAKQRQFTYDWDQDYKTIMKSAGFAGPVLQLVTRLLGGK